MFKMALSDTVGVPSELPPRPCILDTRNSSTKCMKLWTSSVDRTRQDLFVSGSSKAIGDFEVKRKGVKANVRNTAAYINYTIRTCKIVWGS